MKTAIGRIALLAAAASTLVWAQGAGSTGHPEYELKIVAAKDCAAAPASAGRPVLFLKADVLRRPGGKARVVLDAINRIALAEGSFQVLDAVACDDDGARVRLPAAPYTCQVAGPDCDDPTFQKYNVLARLVGTPVSAMAIGACVFAAGEDGAMGTGDDPAHCTAENPVDVRAGGPSRPDDVAARLTAASADVDGDGLLDRVSLFDERLLDYVWTVDAQGRAHAEVFFVPVGK